MVGAIFETHRSVHSLLSECASVYPLPTLCDQLPWINSAITDAWRLETFHHKDRLGEGKSVTTWKPHFIFFPPKIFKEA